MVDDEVILRRIREIGHRVGLLRELGGCGRETFLVDVGVQAQVERHLQVALQATIDIALHVVAADSDETAQDYGSAVVLRRGADRVPSPRGSGGLRTPS